MNVILGIGAMLGYLFIVFVLPILLIRKFILWRKKKRANTGGRQPIHRTKGEFYMTIFLICLNAIPGFIGSKEPILGETVNEDLVGILTFGGLLITLIISVLQSKFRGIPLALLRWIAGLAAGMTILTLFVIIAGMFLLVGVGMVGPGSDVRFFRNGAVYTLRHKGSGHYYDPETEETYEVDEEGTLRDRFGECVKFFL